MAEIHINMTRFNIMFHRVTHNFGWRIKAHWLRIQQGCSKGSGVVFFQPRRNINEMRKTCSVTFWKTIRAKAFDLFETSCGEFWIVAAFRHAGYKFVAKIIHRANVAERGHGAAQAIGLLCCEFCGHDGKLHGLFLEQWHAHGFAEHVDQFVLFTVLR